MSLETENPAGQGGASNGSSDDLSSTHDTNQRSVLSPEVSTDVIRRATAEVIGLLREALPAEPWQAASLMERHTNSALNEWDEKHNHKVKGRVGGVSARQAAELVQLYKTVVLIPAHAADEKRDTAMLAVYDKEEGLYVECTGRTNALTVFVRALIYGAETKYVDEVLATLRDLVPLRRQCADANLVALDDCVYNMRTGERHRYSPDLVFMAKARTRLPETAPELPRIQNADGTWWDPSSWLYEVMGSEALVRTIHEVNNQLLRPRAFGDDKVILYHSESGSNGKGTMLESHRCIVGGPRGLRCASLGLEKFSGDKDFVLTSLLGAAANLADESDPDGFLKSSAMLKAISSHDPVPINRKYKDPIDVKLYVPMIFSVNRLPKIKDKSGAVDRRLHIVPFSARFMSDGSTAIKKNAAIKQDYLRRPEVREWFVWQALMVVGPINTFSQPSEVSAALEEYRGNNDPVLAFWREWEQELDATSLVALPLAMLYDAYAAESKAKRPSSSVESERVFTDRLVAEAVRGGVWQDARDGSGNRCKRSLRGWPVWGAAECRELFGSLGLSMVQTKEFGSSGSVSHDEVVTGDRRFARWTRQSVPADTKLAAGALPARGPCLTRESSAASAPHGSADDYA